MMKKIYYYIHIIANIIFTAILWFLQMWEKPNQNYTMNDWPPLFNEIYKSYIWGWNHKLLIGGVCVIFIILINITTTYLSYRSANKKWVRAVMTHLIKQELEPNHENVRITIFKEKYGISFMWSYILNTLLLNRSIHKKKKLLHIHLYNIPNPIKKYLVIYTRVSNPHENGTSTYYHIPHSEEEICGIVSKAHYNKSNCKIETKSIKDITLDHEKLNDYTSYYQTRLKKYMKDNYIDDFDKLRCIHRKSNQLWASPIINDKLGNIWGIIVIDKESDSVFDQNTKNAFMSYTRILGLSLNHIN